jgi:hypothetical protein
VKVIFLVPILVLLWSHCLYPDPPKFQGIDRVRRNKRSTEQAKKPIEENGNRLPNCSARLRNACQSFDLFADILVWTARESGSDNWAQISGPGGKSTELLQVSFPWDPGLRVGFDYGMEHDLWDTQLAYTWFRTKGRDRASSETLTETSGINSSFFGNFFVNNPTGAGLSGPLYQNASIQWAILFNVFDWELGRKFWISSSLSLRPFLGLKGGWIHQTIHSKWLIPNIPNPSSFGTAKENLKNNFWGVGPSGGLNTKWQLGTLRSHIFSLFGDFSGAILLGRWTFGDIYKNAVPIVISTKNSNIYGAASMLRGLMGFEWDTHFNREQYYFSMKVGFESQFWLDQLQFYSFDIGKQDQALTLQGATIDFAFEF